uniref:Xanthine dehydrogenase oxidase n=1 Tax=Tetraselmis sp. GSL018 TaxID=582737 RepID=A0A061R0B9_9CHLO
MSYANNDQLDWVGISVSDIAGIRHTQKVQEPEYITELVCWINGSKHTVSNPKPTKLLIEFLHENGLTGAKLACGEGGCGCCTVTLAFPEAGGGTSVLPINACLWPLCALDGCVVTTVEGIGSQKQGLHPIQEAVSLHNGSQCGYCTPGWVMSMYGLMEGPGPEGDLPTAREIEAHFDGNLCRCTGYRPILDAFKGFAGGHGGCGELADIEDCAAYRRSPPLPRAVAKEAAERRGLPLHFVDASTGEEWYRPTSLPGLAVLRSRLAAEGKESRLVCAATSAGVRKYYTGAGGGRPYEQHPRPGEEAPVAIDLRGIPELRGSSASTGGLSAGAAVTLSELIGLLDGASQKGGAEGDPRPVWATLARHLRRVANVQVRNAASWAGNLALARACPGFPSDLATILAAARASVEVGSAEDSGITTSHPVEDYVTGRAPDGLLVAITIPPPAQASGDAGRHSLFQTYKTASRHVNAAAIVNAALWAERDREGRVCAARAVFNGLTGSLLRAKAVEKALVGTPLDEAALGVAMAALEQDVAAAGGVAEDGLHSPGYRMGLTRSYLYKFFLEAQGSLPPELSSALVPFVAAEDRGLSEGTQVYGAGDPSLEPVGEAIPKLRARLQATGEAEYASTARSLAGELHAALVYSHTAARRLLAVDPTDALRAPGAVAFFGKPDIPGANRLASEEEPVFFGAGDVVPAVGCLLGIVVARSASEARAAAKVVRQCFEPESRSCPQPEAVAQLSDARRRRAPESGTKATAAALQRHASSRGSLRGAMRTAAARPSPLSVCIGDPRARVGERRASSGASGGAVSGSLETGGQKHFYMETQSCFVVPKDDGGLEVLSALDRPEEDLPAALLLPRFGTDSPIRLVPSKHRSHKESGGEQISPDPLPDSA